MSCFHLPAAARPLVRSHSSPLASLCPMAASYARPAFPTAHDLEPAMPMPSFADLAKRRPSLPNLNLMRLFQRERKAAPAQSSSSADARPPLRQRTNSDAATSPIRTKSKSSKSKKRKAPPADDLATKYGFEFARSVRLLQEMDGGSTEYNVQRLLKKRAKAAARAAASNSTPYHHTCGGVDAAPVQGPDGRLFANAQEREEHQRLLYDADA
ncbi:hypothetical protein EXIGLDRAFT_160830 [Exidia glandulosa HHB12029]|uniref:Uncharacterized protein n=1 Tax=Exidia glandulosa HHB12029 TaxID=1314781 RepID=A0A165FHA9_EXIGL|nr:hypothetical protein EXIGLDRAFT_160830 [Exidia glandulosa HHB12029]